MHFQVVCPLLFEYLLLESPLRELNKERNNRRQQIQVILK